MRHPAENDFRALLSGELPLPEAGRLSSHLDGCPACRDLVGRLTTVSQDPGVTTDVAAGQTLPATRSGPPVIPGFDILRELGRGGFGVVYLAREAATGREVALKVHRAGALASPAEHDSFRAEARAVANLRHPHIVTVLVVGVAHELPYYAMEYLPGGSLARRLDGTPVDPAAAASLVEAVAGAVQHAHERGVIHRDLKPGNILLDGQPGATRFGTPKVADFGIAKHPEAGAAFTPTQAVLGTPSYMAPEQAFGRCRDVGPAADVYALGAVLYELLTGRPPFKGATPYETLLQVRTEEPVPPRRLRPGVPRDLETVCLRCLEKDPAKRYPSAAALAADLRAFLEGRPVAARPVGWAGRLARWGRRNPAVAALAGLSVVLLVSGLAGMAVLWRRAQAEADRATAKAEEADRRQNAAREALRLYTSAAVPLFRNPAAAGKAERESLVRALELYEQVLAESEGDPDEQHRAAFATLQLADGMLALQEVEAAARACRTAVAVLRRLAADHPDNRAFAFDYTQGCAQLAGTLRALGPSDESMPLYREAIRVCEDLVARFPASDHYRGTLASYRTHLASVITPLGALDEAEALFAAALPVTAALLEKYPEDPFRYTAHATVVLRWGDLRLDRRGDPAGYARLVGELLDRCDRLRAERPPRWWAAVAATSPPHCELARVLDKSGQREEARAALRRGAAIWGDVAEANPADARARLAHAGLLVESGHMEWTTDPAAGSELFRRAAGVLERAVTDLDGSPACRVALAQLWAECPDPAVRNPGRALEQARAAAADPRLLPEQRWVLGACLYETGNYPAALAELDRSVRARALGPGHPAWLYRAMALWQTGDRERARAEVRAAADAIRTEPRAGCQLQAALGRAEPLLAP